MKLNTRKKLRNGLEKLTATLSLAALCAFVVAAGAKAQSVLVPPPSIPASLQTTAQTGDTNQVDETGGATSVSASTMMHNNNPFQWGPVVLHPRISYAFSYNTGLQSQPGQSSDSFINTVTPGITLDLGRHWQLGYSAGITFYSDNNFNNTVNHNITLAGQTAYEDWTFSLSQNVAITSDPQIQTAQQTDLQTYSTSFGATYQINDAFSLQLSLAQNVVDASGFTNSAGSSWDWSTMDWLNYQWAPGLTAGAGVGFGYNSVSSGSDMTYQDYQGRFTWQIARKLNLSLNGGAQVRQFRNSGQSSLVSPIFGATITYQPFQFTTLSVNASESISSSYFQNQVTKTTSVNAGLSQRLFGRYFLSLNGGYAVTTYEDSAPGPQQFSGRDDDISSFSVGLSTAFLKRGTASASYSISKTSSNVGGYSYTSNQVGFQLSYGY
jgi:hypothetical protein